MQKTTVKYKTTHPNKHKPAQTIYIYIYTHIYIYIKGMLVWDSALKAFPNAWRAVGQYFGKLFGGHVNNM